MIVGIVGNERAKFTSDGEDAAIAVIRGILLKGKPTKVVSGACHLGGVDLWAVLVAKELGIETQEFRPLQQRQWGKEAQIVAASDEVHCIVVDVLPADYIGMKFTHCYHCHTKDHVKSGGCWTMKQAIKAGKMGKLHIVSNGAIRGEGVTTEGSQHLGGGREK